VFAQHFPPGTAVPRSLVVEEDNLQVQATGAARPERRLCDGCAARDFISTPIVSLVNPASTDIRSNTPKQLVVNGWSWPTAGTEPTGANDNSSSRICHSGRHGGYELETCRPVILGVQP
jgi:hypothetical protein